MSFRWTVIAWLQVFKTTSSVWSSRDRNILHVPYATITIAKTSRHSSSLGYLVDRQTISYFRGHGLNYKVRPYRAFEMGLKKEKKSNSYITKTRFLQLAVCLFLNYFHPRWSNSPGIHPSEHIRSSRVKRSASKFPKRNTTVEHCWKFLIHSWILDQSRTQMKLCAKTGFFLDQPIWKSTTYHLQKSNLMPMYSALFSRSLPDHRHMTETKVQRMILLTAKQCGSDNKEIFLFHLQEQYARIDRNKKRLPRNDVIK